MSNSKKDDKRPIWVIDAETDPFAPGRLDIKPFIWGLYDGENYHEFSEWEYDTPEGATAALVNHIEQNNVIVYAHNGGKFDYHFLLPHINLYEPLKIISGRLASFRIGLAEFRDSYNILPVPLSAWEKDEFDYTILEKEARSDPNNKTKIRRYLRNDCLYLYDMVTQFINEYGRHLTQAGAAMRYWEKMREEKAPRSTPGYYERLKAYYYGGRVECFQHGIIKRKFKVIDINSAYPYAMLHKHPISTDYEIFYGLPPKKLNIDLGPTMMKIECVSKGAFPFRRDDGRLIFPSDNEKRIYTVTGWEYLAAKRTKTIRDVTVLETRAWTSPGALVDFADYINYFYNKRKEAKKTGNKADNLFSKLFMNSLYGKFSSMPERYREYEAWDEWHENEDGFRESGELGPHILVAKELDDKAKRYYNIATAASITGFVRAYLWEAICKCDGVLYCDTDSIAAVHIPDSIKMSDELGDWEIEGEFIQAAIAGKKMYSFKQKNGRYKIASKGVKLSPQQIERVARGETVTYIPDAPTFSVHKEPVLTYRKIRLTK